MISRNENPSSGYQYFIAVLFWVVAWWLIDLAPDDAVGKAVAVFFALIGMGLAIGGARDAISTPSPFKTKWGRIAWALRPRPWVLCWLGLLATIGIFGKPMFLWNYGGGECVYIDWNFTPHVRSAHGDGAFRGCRYLTSRR